MATSLSVLFIVHSYGPVYPVTLTALCQHFMYYTTLAQKEKRLTHIPVRARMSARRIIPQMEPARQAERRRTVSMALNHPRVRPWRVVG